ncbi:hypothetical protein IFM89_015866 [Coptis chinensis]|uniref:Uncharacterized protein n=1 Tax=Coptis chinensis TaxID=261450 RepID=A0A835IPL8_9MAGN|nr:hypothetical protein IFM89_015866 [Coptis chinensis]
MLVKKNDSVKVYYGNLKKGWDELAHYKSQFLASISGMTPVIAKELHKASEDEQVYQFLLGLRDEYETLRCQILGTFPLPSPSEAYAMEKKSASSRPLNIEAEKKKILRREMEVAESKRNKAEVERIQARLKELEAISKQKKGLDTKAVRLAEMKKKNRTETIKIASEKKAINTGLKEGEEGYNPFSRRWTRSINYYVSNTAGGDQVAASANGDVAAESGLGVGSGSVVAGVTGVVFTLGCTTFPMAKIPPPFVPSKQ